jgi:hypothetical protein
MRRDKDEKISPPTGWCPSLLTDMNQTYTKEKCETVQEGDVKTGFTDTTHLPLVSVFIHTSEA